MTQPQEPWGSAPSPPSRTSTWILQSERNLPKIWGQWTVVPVRWVRSVFILWLVCMLACWCSGSTVSVFYKFALFNLECRRKVDPPTAVILCVVNVPCCWRSAKMVCVRKKKNPLGWCVWIKFREKGRGLELWAVPSRRTKPLVIQCKSYLTYWQRLCALTDNSELGWRQPGVCTKRRERRPRLDTLAGGQQAAFGEDVWMEWKVQWGREGRGGG